MTRNLPPAARLFAAALIALGLFWADTFGGKAYALDNTLHGYGQGRQVDEDNRPLGALDFNGGFSGLNAYAITDSPEIVLTFDQGYENGYTEKILDTLKEKNVKAVFFLTGDYAKKCPDLIRRMIDEGHIIGNHGMRHASLPKLSEEDMREEIMSLHEFVRETYGYEMKYFRPPCGEYSEQALSAVKDCGYTTLLWSFAYCDWDVNSQPDKAESLTRVTDAAHKGAVYLLHSVSETNCAILPQAIDNIRAAGFEFGLPDV
ncbi:MAG: polysaccharide deacetylase family protein [Ruminococcus sp.]|nr:polysaccharide deacetylase family protein [Ruminococcus sp.]